jgi:hypothetical protein
MPSLATISNSFELISNLFSSLPILKLAFIGSSFQLGIHPELLTLSLPSLNTIGEDFHVMNNTEMKILDLEKLKAIEGDENLGGSFTR